MTAEEEKEMGKKIAQSQKPDVSRMIADEIREETVRQNAQREERRGAKQDNREPDYPTKTTLPMKPRKRTGWRTAERSALVPCCP